MDQPPRIAIAWKGLPAYGARLIRSGVDAVDVPVAVIGTRAAVPVADVESIVGRPVIWLEDRREYSWKELKLDPPKLLIETSWATPAFNSLTNEAKRAGCQVVCMIDNSWKANFRQIVGAAYYRLHLGRNHDIAWVPGSSGRRFCRVLGFPDDRIFEGLYSGWSDKFTAGPSLEQRPQRFVFVGQYILRKGVDILAEAYRDFIGEHPDWQLSLYGSGPLQATAEAIPQASAHPFKQTDEIAAQMQNSRFFVLPARTDNWPLVVHEAASSGCALVLSSEIGNAPDLANSKNAIIFKAGSASALAGALGEAAQKNEAWLREAGAESRRLASNYSPERWARVFRQFCAGALPERRLDLAPVADRG